MTGDVFSTNLPLALTSFIGREHEMAEIKLLLSTTRLLTLTGAGGSGKTRLALQVAGDLLDNFVGGVWLIELADLSDPTFVPQAVADVLGIRESPRVLLLDTLVDYLHAKQLLLVLDNCEHVVEECARLVERLLRACPNLKILATSREDLGLLGETTFRIPGLTLPDTDSPPSPETFGLSEAIRLFVERAASIQPDFQLTDETARGVAQICERLDGLPLAIELAAKRVKTLSVRQIADHLDDRFRFLTTGSRTAAPRQQTLLATIEWSHNLLSAEEQILLRRLSVFAGGWTLEAAEVVGGGTLDTLTRLVDKSLAYVEEQDGEARYHMLETVREYAYAKLKESGQEKRVRRRHLEFFVQFIWTAERGLKGGEQRSWLEQVDTELENLRSAFNWALENDPEAGLSLGSALLQFWDLYGYLVEGRAWMSRLLDQTPLWEGTVKRVRLLNVLGFLAWYQYDFTAARILYDQSLALARRLDSQTELMHALLGVGMTMAFQSIAEEAESSLRLLEQAAKFFEQTEDEWHTAFVLFVLGVWALNRDDYVLARSFLTASHERFSRLGDRYHGTMPLLHLAEVERAEGDNQKARAILEEIVNLRRQLHRSARLGISLRNLGRVLVALDDYRRATMCFHESLALLREQGHYPGVVGCLAGLADVLEALGKPREALHLRAYVETLQESTGLNKGRAYGSYAAYERNITRSSADLVGAAYALTSTEERRLTLDQAIDLAVRETAPALEGISLPSRNVETNPVRPDLAIFALGQTQVQYATREITASDWKYTKARELFYYLLCFSPRTREQIGLDLWPEASPAQLRGNLKVTLYHLRHALGRSDWILFENSQYSFNRALNYWFDVEAFKSHLAEARQAESIDANRAVELLEQAAKLYQGNFLAGWTQGEWYLPLQRELEREYVATLLLLGQFKFARGQYGEAAEVYRKAISHDSYQETAHRELMRCLARQGERGQALRHYRELEKQLEEEVGAQPAAETKTLYEQLRRGEKI